MDIVIAIIANVVALVIGTAIFITSYFILECIVNVFSRRRKISVDK